MTTREKRIQSRARAMEAKHGDAFPKLPTEKPAPRPVGRPKKTISLDQSVTFRATAQESDAIDQLAERWQCDRSEAVRRAVMLAATLP